VRASYINIFFEVLYVDEYSGAVQNFVGIHKGSTESPTGIHPISTPEVA
jgi:hypothetical protein